MKIDLNVTTLTPEERVQLLKEIVDSFDHTAVIVKGVKGEKPPKGYKPKTIEVAVGGYAFSLGHTMNPTLTIEANLKAGSYVRREVA